MRSLVNIVREIDPPESSILIEGLPGIGFVANIASLHLINELKAVKIAEIKSPTFQDLLIALENGSWRQSINELYYCEKNGKNLLILYGNTQALTTYGQYELCESILDLAERYNCKQVICMGGLRKDSVSKPPKVFCTATDLDTLSGVLKFGVGVLHGYVVGVAGILIGLAKLRNLKGFCLLAETLGTYPDAAAARAALEVLCKYLDISVNMDRLFIAEESTKRILRSLGMLRE